MWAHTVNDAEVDGLGAAAHFLGHFLGLAVIYLRRCSCVHVLITVEHSHQVIVVAECSAEAQLKLAIVCTDQLFARCSYECSADLAPQFGAHGYVLQVWVGATQPPGLGNGKVERSMHTRLLVDQQRQGVYVGILELRYLAPLRNEVNDGMLAAELVQLAGSGTVA